MHQTLKNQIAKLRQGEFKYLPLHIMFYHALFVINLLNMDIQKGRLQWNWIPEGAGRPLVKWKDFLIDSGKETRCSCNFWERVCLCVSTVPLPVWIPDKLIRHVQSHELSRSRRPLGVTEIPGVLSPGQGKDGEIRSSLSSDLREPRRSQRRVTLHLRLHR